MPEPLKVFDNVEDAAETIQDDERLEPPPGVNREIWDRIPQDVHRKAAQVARALFNMPADQETETP